MKGKRTILAAIAVATFLLVGLPELASAQGQKIKVGASVSLTGGFANEGNLVKKGYETWAEWVNGRGGIEIGGKNFMVDMIYYDDKSDATTNGKLTEKLITEDQVNFILGPFSTNIAAATSAIGERYGYVTIAPFANGDEIYDRGFKYLFSLLSMTSRDLVPVAELAAQQSPKPKTFAVVSMDYYFSIAGLNGAKKRSQELGMEEVYYTKFPMGGTDFSGILTTLKSKKPDLVYFGGLFNESVAFYRQAKELNFNAKLYTTTGSAGHPNWLTVMKKDGDYVIGQQPWHPDMSYKGPFFSSQTFTEFWKQKYGTIPPFFSAGGFATGILMQIAISKAGGLEQAKIRDALRAIDIETFFGKFKYDESGRNTAARMGVIQVQNGKQVLIDPPRAGVNLLYPAPPWNER